MAEIRIDGAAGAKLAQMLEAATPERVGELSGRVAEADAEVELMLERKAAAEAKARRARACYAAAVKARDELALELAMTAKLAGVDLAVGPEPVPGASGGRGPPALGRVPPRPRGRAHPAQPRPASARARSRRRRKRGAGGPAPPHGPKGVLAPSKPPLGEFPRSAPKLGNRGHQAAGTRRAGSRRID